jgi:hypothetical protein
MKASDSGKKKKKIKGLQSMKRGLNFLWPFLYKSIFPKSGKERRRRKKRFTTRNFVRFLLMASFFVELGLT